MVILKYGGRGVDVALKSERNPGPDTVYWSPRKPTGGGYNSFVVVADERGPFVTSDGARVALISINGIGEIRWSVDRSGSWAEGSIEHFALTAVPQ